MTRRDIFGAIGLFLTGAVVPRLNARPWYSPKNAVVTAKSALGAQTMLTDKWRNVIPLAFEWNMDTETAGLFIGVYSTSKTDKLAKSNRVAVTGRSMRTGEVAKVFAHLPGCKLRWREDGKLVTREEVIAGYRNKLAYD